MNYRLAMFDFDGTLADTFPWAMSLYEELAEKHSLPKVDPASYDRLRSYSIGEMLQDFSIPAWRLPRIGAYVKRQMSQNLDRLALFAGIRDMVKTLAAPDNALRLAIVSSNDEDNIRAVLGLEIAACFDHYECGVALFGKASKLRRTLKQLGIPHDAAIYIGDEIRDLEAAREAGIDFGAVTWGYNTRASLAAHKPTLLFNSVAEITETLIHHGR